LRPVTRWIQENKVHVTAVDIERHLRSLADPWIAAQSRRFFKTGPGEYGQGDEFLGIRVPVVRQYVRRHRYVSLETALALLKSQFHEVRLLALLILVAKYAKSNGDPERREIYRAYLANTAFINNWDLVDVTAEHIVGSYLFCRNRRPLYRLAKSKSLWERRIAIMSTLHFIRQGDFEETVQLAEVLLHDAEDLIHKAVGWMLREIGNRDRDFEEQFLRSCYHNMPRTMLRYAIEKFPEYLRQAYLKGTVST
jgi:3-methyladenine DNA glycosylase AlkD